VIAERDRVHADLEHAVCKLRRDPDAVSEVLAVQDDDIGAQLFAKRRKALFEGATARDADGVGNEQNSQGSVSVAAGRSSIET
jgi:hypothetical protein